MSDCHLHPSVCRWAIVQTGKTVFIEKFQKHWPRDLCHFAFGI